MGLTNINKNFDVNQNFWEINTQLKIMSPFSKLYERDKSKGKLTSSKEMWVIFFLCDPDEEANKFAMLLKDNCLALLKETFYPEFNETDELIVECLNQYPELCMSKIEKMFYLERKQMEDRNFLINSTKYTLDDYERNEKGDVIFIAGKPMVKKGTQSQLDKMKLDTVKIFEQYEIIESKFKKAKTESRLKGGRAESAIERGLL